MFYNYRLRTSKAVLEIRLEKPVPSSDLPPLH